MIQISKWSYGPVAFYIYVALNIILCVRLLKTNRLVKTGIIMLLSCLFLYVPPMLVRASHEGLQNEIDDANILKANLFSWNLENLDNNINLIVIIVIMIS